MELMEPLKKRSLGGRNCYGVVFLDFVSFSTRCDLFLDLTFEVTFSLLGAYKVGYS